MSKAILIMSMPTCCDDCAISCGDDYMNICPINGKSHDVSGKRPDWCPLKEVPEKQVRDYPEYDKYINGYDDGWDACLEEILGE